MSVVALTSLASLAGTVALVVLVALRWRHRGLAGLGWFVAVLLAALLFDRLSNTLQWSGMTGGLDPIEDYVQIVIPLAFLFLFYGYVQVGLRRELAASEAKFRQIAEQALDVIFITNAEGRLTYVSPSSKEVFGVDVEEALGRPFLDFLEPCERERIDGVFRETLAGLGRVRAVQIQMVRRDGERFPSEVNAAVVARDEEAFGVIGIVRDISSRRQAEAERERLEGQLLQAQKMEAVGRLAGGVAHDFNNLLTGISGNAELSLMELESSRPQVERAHRLRSFLEQVLHAVDRAASLTRQLLAFSRKQVIEPKVLDLNEVIARTTTMLQRLIGEDVELRLRLDAERPLILADVGQLEQIIVNLAVNARDAMVDGGTLTIETAEGPWALTATLGAGAVFLSVSDTGVGMDEETKALIFEPFFTTKPQEKGTGLGLSVIYGIVMQHGGVIEVDSSPGRGSTFRVGFPRADGEVTLSLGGGEPVRGGSERVLIVEDDGLVRSATAEQLRQFGYRVLEADGSEEALRLVEGQGEVVDLLLTDVVMPGLNGRELAERLTAHCPRLTVLYTSGYPNDVIAHHGVLDEGLSFIGKPYLFHSLARKVREVLDLSR